MLINAAKRIDLMDIIASTVLNNDADKFHLNADMIELKEFCLFQGNAGGGYFVSDKSIIFHSNSYNFWTIITSRVPIRKKEFGSRYDEMMMKHDVVALNTASKCLARMKGYWDPEFEPRVEEIVDYPMISLSRFSQFAFSSELAFRAGGFPYSVAGEGQPAQAARPNIHVYGACAVCRCVLVRIMAAYSKRGAILL